LRHSAKRYKITTRAGKNQRIDSELLISALNGRKQALNGKPVHLSGKD
jgi:hypothetical protein